MSYLAATEPKCTETAGAIELIVESKHKSLGSLPVRRVLPSPERRMVGPFIFFDHMGPAEFTPGEGIQVRPHPHIGIATITYLFEGEIMHRDSLGVVQPIRAGAVNLMTAGRGIVHSERAGEDLNTTSRLNGIQSWIALPADMEDCEPTFAHYPAKNLPQLDRDGITVRVIIGEAYGHRSRVTSYSPTLYLECRLAAGSELTLPEGCEEIAAYVVRGDVRIERQSYGAGVMAVAAAGRSIRLSAAQDSHVMVIGGASVGERRIWWNFVASTREKIERAKSDWKTGRFEPVPGETESIPLPD